MRQGFLYHFSPFSRLIFAGFITISVFLIILFVGTLVLMAIFHFSFAELPLIMEDYNNPDNLIIIKYFQLLQSVGLFIVPPFIIGYFISKQPFIFLKFKNNSPTRLYVLAGLIMLMALPAINFLADINSKMSLPESLASIENWMKSKEELAKDLTLEFVKAENFQVFLFNLFMIAIIPALGEELLFRGVVQQLIIDWVKKPFWGIFIAAFLFSFLHFQFYGFVPRLILGILLGYLFFWSNNIWLSIFAHFINNGLAVFAYYKFGADYVSDKIDKIGTNQAPVYYLFLSIILVSFLLFYYKKLIKLEKWV